MSTAVRELFAEFIITVIIFPGQCTIIFIEFPANVKLIKCLLRFNEPRFQHIYKTTVKFCTCVKLNFFNNVQLLGHWTNMDEKFIKIFHFISKFIFFNETGIY